ncbi:hypothetical protein LCGC14_2896270, partial [marine sediment metagenome]
LCRTRTVSNVCKSLVERGFDIALNGKKRDTPPRAKLLEGEQEAKIIALRLGKPPEGYNNWSLRLIAEKTVNLAGLRPGLCTAGVSPALLFTLPIMPPRRRRYDSTAAAQFREFL